MGLQIQVTGDSEYGRYIKLLLAGQPGSGKTLLSSTAPHPFYADVEGRLMSVASRHVPFTRIRSSQDLLQLKELLEQPADVRERLLGHKVETVIIDTVDELARIIVRERLKAQKKDQLAPADWGWFGDQLREILRAFRSLDMHVIFACHTKAKEDSETGRQIYVPSIQGAVGGEIAEYVDLALVLKARQVTQVVGNESKKTLVRYIQTTPDTNYEWIKDHSGKLPPEFPVNFTDDFQRIYDLVYGDLEPAPAGQLGSSEVAATPVVEDSGTAEASLEVPSEKIESSDPAAACEVCGADVSANQADLCRLKRVPVACKDHMKVPVKSR